MSNAFLTGVLLWLGTYALHSTLILGGVWLFEQFRKNASPALRETVWRTAVLTGIVTASLQISGIARPVVGHVPVSLGEPSSRAAATEIDRALTADLPSTIALPRDEADSGAATRLAVDDADRAGPANPSRRLVSVPEDTGPNDSASATSPDWRRVVLALWLAGALILSGRIACMAMAARRELADRTPIVRGALFERIQQLAHDAGLRRLPRVSLSSRIAGPLTLPNGEICIPAWAHERLSPSQLDAMLAHEMAHALRRDPLWLLVGLAVQTVFFFQPLNALARKRLTLLAELSADDWSVTRTGNGRALAECLAEFAEITHSGAAPVFAAAMARGKSSLVQRIQRLLDGRYTKGVLSMKSKVLIGLGAILLAGVIPGLMAQNDTAGSRSSSVNIENTDGEVSLDISVTTDDYRLEVQGEGDMEFAPDGSGVSELSNSSYLDVTMRRDGRERRVRFEGQDGDIEREFWIDGDRQPWNADADRFVAEIMPIVFRETGISARERVVWLLQEGGHEALLEEIDLIGSDFVQRLYTVHYAEAATIPDAHFERLMNIAEAHMGSDFELRTTLTKVYETQEPTGANLVALVEAGNTIGSDFEARMLLELVGRAMPNTADVLATYVDVAGSIGSDFEMRQALLPVVTRADLADDALWRAIEIAGRDIGSDFELRSLLSEAAVRVGESDMLASIYVSAADTIGSDFEHKQALLALANGGGLSATSWRLLLESAQSIGSDFECASLLATIAPQLPVDDDVVAAYRATLETIGSDFERRRAAQALNLPSL